MSKPEKLFMQNTNISYALTYKIDIGSARESFFVNQIKESCKINYSKVGDFLMDDKYIVEIGGAKKSYKQIKDIKNSFVVSDDIEIGSGNKIPLWLCGFLY